MDLLENLGERSVSAELPRFCEAIRDAGRPRRLPRRRREQPKRGQAEIQQSQQGLAGVIRGLCKEDVPDEFVNSLRAIWSRYAPFGAF